MTAEDPIVFISKSRVRPGQAQALRAFLEMGAKSLAVAKPDTLAFLAYLDEAATTLTIVHVFANADGLEAHVAGAAQRSSRAAEFIETASMTVYGAPSAAGEAAIRHGLASDVPVEVGAAWVDGFLRLAPPSSVRSDTAITGG
jgi:hypothetical protein